MMTQPILGPTDPNRLYTLPALARATGDSLRELRAAVRSGKLRARRRGERWFYVVFADYLAWRDAEVYTPPPPDGARSWAEQRVVRERLEGRG